MDTIKRQYLQVGAELSGIVPSAWDEALTLVRMIKNHPDLKGRKIYLVGQCLGGSFAQYVGLQERMTTVCFNCLPLGCGLQEAIGKEKLKLADRHVIHVSARGDFISEQIGLYKRICNIIRFFCRLLGIRTPGNYGKRYRIPTAYSSTSDTHGYFLGSLTKHSGYTRDTKTNELSKEDLRYATNCSPKLHHIHSLNRQEGQPAPTDRDCFLENTIKKTTRRAGLSFELKNKHIKPCRIHIALVKPPVQHSNNFPSRYSMKAPKK